MSGNIQPKERRREEDSEAAKGGQSMNLDELHQEWESWDSFRRKLSSKCKYLMGGCKEHGGNLSSLGSSNGTRGTGQKLKCHLNTGKWGLLQGWWSTRTGYLEVMESPTMEIIKSWQDTALNNLLQVIPAWAEGLEWRMCRGPFPKLIHSMDLWFHRYGSVSHAHLL